MNTAQLLRTHFKKQMYLYTIVDGSSTASCISVTFQLLLNYVLFDCFDPMRRITTTIALFTGEMMASSCLSKIS